MFLPILLIFVLLPTQPSKALGEFSQFTKAVGEEVSLVTHDGRVFEGTVASATADALTLTVGRDRHHFGRDGVVKADRLKDGVADGIVRGVLLGVVMGALATQGCPSNDSCGTRMLMASTAIYGALGWALDAGQHNRQPLYRAAQPANGFSVKLSRRF